LSFNVERGFPSGPNTLRAYSALQRRKNMELLEITNSNFSTPGIAKCEFADGLF
jgi:hypothetical protein